MEHVQTKDLRMSTANAVYRSPLCVDLDGTLTPTDLLWESVLMLIKQRPLAALIAPIYLLRGRAALKRFIASRVRLDVSCLPYNSAFIDWLRQERAKGRSLVLATASDELLAKQVATNCHLFDEMI